MNVLPGDYYGEVTPVPIPNTEVKLSYADGTAFGRESRSSPGFFYCSEFIKVVSFKKRKNYLSR